MLTIAGTAAAAMALDLSVSHWVSGIPNWIFLACMGGKGASAALGGAGLSDWTGVWLVLCPCVERMDITLRAHAMAVPRPDFRTNACLAALREAVGPLLFAHADLSGLWVFEEVA